MLQRSHPQGSGVGDGLPLRAAIAGTLLLNEDHAARGRGVRSDAGRRCRFAGSPEGRALLGLEPESYEIVRRLGAGADFDLFEATHPRLPGRHAIELYKSIGPGPGPDATRAFCADVATVAGLHHPNVVAAVD